MAPKDLPTVRQHHEVTRMAGIVPYRLHSRKICADGSPAWSAQWEAWLSQAHVTAAIERVKPRDWWEDDYIYGRLVAHAESPQATFSLDELNVALAWYRGEAEDVATGAKTPKWAWRAVKRVHRHVKQYLLSGALLPLEAA